MENEGSEMNANSNQAPPPAAKSDEIQLKLEVVASQSLSYLYIGTRKPTVHSISVTNVGPEATTGTLLYPRVRIESPLDEPVAEDWEGRPLRLLAPSNENPTPLKWGPFKMAARPQVLGRLPEKVNASLIVEILNEKEKVVKAWRHDILLLAANEWILHDSYGASLAAFVTPNAREIKPVLERARELLEKSTGDPSTQGYQVGSERAHKIARAVYEALREQKIVYSNPPAAFEKNVQKVRTATMVLEAKEATCLDSTVLYASCLAAVGLDPVLFLVKNHAFSGYFTKDNLNLPQSSYGATGEEKELIFDLVKKGYVQPVETTTLCDGPGSANFTAACTTTSKYWADARSEMEYMLIPHNAWNEGFASPPTTGELLMPELGGPGDVLSEGLSEEESLSLLISPDPVAIDVNSGDDQLIPPRVRQWQSSLLDLSARNQLLKMKTDSAKFMEFEIPPDLLAEVDDKLFSPDERLLIKTPADLPLKWRQEGVMKEEFDRYIRNEPSPLVFPHFGIINDVPRAIQKRVDDPESTSTNIDIEREVYSILEEVCRSTIAKKISNIKSAAEEVRLESGTNAVHLALGAVSWEEATSSRGGKKVTQWEAPLFLYPVIISGSKSAGFSIRLDQTGAITPNYCLREKLRREPYNIDLPELEYPEADESGIDLEAMIGSIEAKLSEQKLTNFSVLRKCVLGVFDYSTFRLWKDLRDDWEKMRDANPVVRHLMYTPRETFKEEIGQPETPIEPYLPLPGDDSQSEAIQWAIDGRSFRIEGPPGTGKTQTIANLIASCVAHGKKILFVAEKFTALEQVKKRLHSIGLDDYCLEMHANGDSDTQIRRKLRKQLSEAIDAHADPKDGEWSDLTKRSESYEKSLDKYRDALHEPGDAGISLWDAREDLYAMGEGEFIEIPRDFLKGHQEKWATFQEIVYEFSDRAEAAVSLVDNPWGFVDGVSEGLNKGELSGMISRLAATLEEFRELTGPLKTLHNVTAVAGLKAAIIAAALEDRDALPAESDLSLVGGATWERLVVESLGQCETIENRLEAARKAVQPTLVNRLDIDELQRLALAVGTAGMFSRRKHSKALIAALGDDALTMQASELATAVEQVHAEITEIKALSKKLKEEIGLVHPDDWHPMVGDSVQALEGMLSEMRVLAAYRSSPGVSEFIGKLANGPEVNQLQLAVVKQVVEDWRDLSECIQITEFSSLRWVGEGAFLEAWSTHQPSWLSDGGNDRYLELDRWLGILGEANRLVDCGLPDLRNSVLSGAVPLNEIENRARRGVLQAVYTERLEAGEIDHFDGLRHDQHVKNLERSLGVSRSLLTERIPGLVSQRKVRPRVKLKKPIGGANALLHDLKVKKPKKPIRTLIQEHGEALSDVMPCFLMSPASVSTFVPVDAITFDVVIFDEASQVRTSHAIGALGRGLANIVVGDSKQMPPTNFFSSNSGRFVDDESSGLTEEELESDLLLLATAAADLESILEEFEGARLPYLQLLVHYRSRDESLIAFSNSYIYEKPMLTFPSATPGSQALQFCHVDGQFVRPTTDPKKLTEEHKKCYNDALEVLKDPRRLVGTNPSEAWTVATEVMHRLRDPETQKRRQAGVEEGAESIVVVTLNVAQKTLIEELLKKIDGDGGEKVFEIALTGGKDEQTGVVIAEPQLKIRNLESVQGDEADTVMLSIAFSKRGIGERGAGTKNVPMNFGPVTNPGGHRRLNVAITRARSETIVFCSFEPDDMNVKPTSSEDAQLLQQFLQLAFDGVEKHGDVGQVAKRSHHINDIASAIEEMGYRVKKQIGLSEFRVDIAVGHPNETDWKVAVLIDGPDWAKRGSATQREILPQAILNIRGWSHIHRVWLPSWRDERQAILDRIRTAMEGADGTARAEIVLPPLVWNTETEKITEENVHEESVHEEEFQQFESAIGDEGLREVLDVFANPSRSNQSTINWAREQFEDAAKKVLAVEAPIELNRLAKHICTVLGFDTARKQRIEIVKEELPEELVTRSKFGEFVWQTSTQADTWVAWRHSEERHRQPEEIAPQEYCNALRDIVTDYGSLSKEDCLEALRQQFGFGIKTAKIGEHVDAIFAHAVETAVVAIGATGKVTVPGPEGE
jgi:hypothetical protein